ncbi:MAG TPA: nuclear transport factor 2 family protein [Herpetosiphonaceae bacterium]
MDLSDFEQWLGALGRAWEGRDPHAAAALFSADASYSEDPFEPALRGRDSVLRYWQAETAAQEAIAVRFAVLGFWGAGGAAHWNARFRRIGSGEAVELDGALVVSFDRDGRCAELREWWHRRERQASDEFSAIERIEQ